MRIVYRRSALADLDAIHRYVSGFDIGAADRLIDRIHAAIARLETHPMSARPARRRGLRILSVPSRPYVVIHRVMTDHVEIVGIMHTARRRNL